MRAVASVREEDMEHTHTQRERERAREREDKEMKQERVGWLYTTASQWVSE